MIIVKTTFLDAREARALAVGLVSKKLVASVQLKQVESIYAREYTPEIELSCITAKGLQEEVFAAIRSHHSYTLPQIIAVPITATLEFHDWVYTQTK